MWLSFVSGMVNLYYQTDRDVQQDAELQAWIRDVTQEGFTELPNFGRFLFHSGLLNAAGSLFRLQQDSSPEEI